MKTRWSILILAAVFLAAPSTGFAETVKSISSADVYFSPRGGCTEAAIKEIDEARKEIVVHAYAFPSYEIARALAKARERGVKVTALLDKSQKREKDTTAYVLEKAGILIYIDSEHPVANSNVMVIDGDTVITGSFGFTKAAEEKNAEDMLIIRSKNVAKLYLKNFDRHMAHSGIYKP
jgi:phosphatidylserine/phosphatidylglycerophosphate/cardiolipin synthase-like enzyme